MILTKEQNDYIDARYKEIDNILSYKPEQGWLALKMEQQQLRLFRKLSNIEAKNS